MPRHRSPNRDKAFEVYKSNNGNITPIEISKVLNESVTNIRTWKNIDKWDIQLGFKRNKKGAPKGNKNAKGNKSGAAKGNLNHLKHGKYIDNSKFASTEFLKKYIPKVTANIIDDIEKSKINGLDMLWGNIILQQTTIVRMQNIMHVKDSNDINKELTKVCNGKNNSKEWVIQFADDRQSKFARTLSDSVKTLNRLIKDYEEMLHKNWDLATEEQKVRIEVLKSKIINNEKSKEDKIDEFFDKLEKGINNA